MQLYAALYLGPHCLQSTRLKGFPNTKGFMNRLSVQLLCYHFSKPQEGLQQMFEKSLEDFYCICDQLEINLVRQHLKCL